jgi:hypothetical protein
MITDVGFIRPGGLYSKKIAGDRSKIHNGGEISVGRAISQKNPTAAKRRNNLSKIRDFTNTGIDFDSIAKRSMDCASVSQAKRPANIMI